MCELHGMAAIGMHDPEIHRGRVAVGTNRIIRHVIDNLAAIGRPFGFLSAVTHACAGGQLRLACAVSVYHPDIARAIGQDVPKRLLEPSGDQSALPSCTPWRGWVSWRTLLPSALAEKIAAVFWLDRESPARRCVLSDRWCAESAQASQSPRCWAGLVPRVLRMPAALPAGRARAEMVDVFSSVCFLSFSRLPPGDRQGHPGDPLARRCNVAPVASGAPAFHFLTGDTFL